MEEVWKTVYAPFDNYEVSNHGRVRNKKTKSVLKDNIQKFGYRYVTLYVKWNGYHKTIPIHRIVGFAFVPNPKPDTYREINHIYRNSANNLSNNLEWCDRRYNNVYAGARQRAGAKISASLTGRKLGAETKAKIAAHPHIKGNTNRRKTVYMYNDEGVLLRTFDSTQQAEDEMGINRCNISACCYGKIKHAGKYRWNYEIIA